jgi:ligand-binding sensor domain-containing protein
MICAQAQHYNIRYQKLTYDDVELRITKVFQDRSGFMWLGAKEGLFRYDGVALERYFSANSDSIFHVTSFFEDAKNTLWIGTASGKIFIRKNETISPFEPEEGLPKVSITAIVQDRFNHLWFATYGEGLYCYTANRLFNFNTDDGISDNYFYDLKAHSSGWVIGGTDAGINLAMFANKKKYVKTIDEQNGLPDNIVTAIHYQGENKFLLGTESKGIVQFNISNLKLSKPFSSTQWSYGKVSDFISLSNASWAVTVDSGLVALDLNTNKTTVVKSNSVTLNSGLAHAYIDTEGNIWMVNMLGKLAQFNPMFSFYAVPNQSNRNLYAVLQDDKNNLLYADGVSVGCINAEGKLNDAAFLKIPAISMAKDQLGNIWFGTFNQGVYLYNTKTRKVINYTEKNGLVNNNVLSISCKKNEVWFATLGGVSRALLIDNQYKFESYNHKSSLGASYIYQVFVDSKNNVWFATEGNGLVKYESNGAFKKVNFAGTQKLKSVYGLAEDAKGKIWINAGQAGLYFWNGAKLQQYPKLSGLKFDEVAAMFFDNKDRLLMLKRLGIDVLNVSTGLLLHHTDELGLGDIEPNLNAGFNDGNGNVWIASNKQLVKYNAGFNLLDKGAQAIITNKYVLNQPITEGEQNFTYDQNFFMFEYAGLWYHNPEEVVYQIKLDGYDKDWIRTKNKRVTYPKLPPGKYVFRIRVSADANPITYKEMSYTFVISRPFWVQWWFILISIAGFVFVVFYWFKQREIKIQERQILAKEKISFQFETLKSQINPHFLFNSFNTLIGLIETNTSHAVEYVEHLSDFYRNILNYRDKEVITLNEELHLLDDYIFLQKKRYGEKLLLVIDKELQSNDLFIAPLTLQMLLENAIKHNVISTEDPLIVYLKTEGDYLVIGNKVNLKTSAVISTQTGLQNINSRYKILTQKDIVIKQTEGLFEVYIPLIKQS